MIIKYNRGFEYNGILYGWKEKKLYRLPQTISGKEYPLKEVPMIKVGSKTGYLLRGMRKSLSQVKGMTTEIDFTLEVIESDDIASNDDIFPITEDNESEVSEVVKISKPLEEASIDGNEKELIDCVDNTSPLLKKKPLHLK